MMDVVLQEVQIVSRDYHLDARNQCHIVHLSSHPAAFNNNGAVQPAKYYVMKELHDLQLSPEERRGQYSRFQEELVRLVDGVNNCNVLSVLGTTLTEATFKEGRSAVPTLISKFCEGGSLRARLFHISFETRVKALEQPLELSFANEEKLVNFKSMLTPPFSPHGFHRNNNTNNRPHDDDVFPLSRHRKLAVLTGIASGLNYLHSRGLPHLALTATHVLLDDELVPLLSGYAERVLAHALDLDGTRHHALEAV
jgi:serine/threonine protein kinase